MIPYFKVKLKSNGNKTALFQTILNRKGIKFLPVQTLLYTTFKNILISLTSFIDIPNSMKTL
jgi:hypothetical protein